jgi:type I restriction enzyme, S subunit
MNGDNGELPEGWASGALPEAAEIVMGQSPPGSTYNEEGKGLPFFQGKAEFGDLHPTARKWCTAPTKLAQAGDILISIRAPVGPTNIATEKCAIGRGLAVVRARSAIENRWLLYALRLQEDQLAEQGTGSTFTAINREHLDAVELPLPPLAEQRRIVAAVEAVLAKVNAARERLNRVPAILKRFRQAVLSAACSGRLTADWREKNSHHKPEDTGTIELSDPPLDTPETWQWAELGQVASVERGKFTVRPRNDPRYYGGEHPFVQIGDLPPDGGSIQAFHQTLNAAGLGVSRSFPKGTALIAIVGATIGNSGVLAFDSCCPDSLVAIQGTSSNTQFLEFYLRLRKAQIRAESYASGGQPNINLQTLRPLPVPTPPLAEQQEIVRRVDKLFALADVIESRLTDARRMADQLTQAVLAKAFRGELVPTEAELARREKRSYESAADLLSRIRAEREQPAPKPARTRKPKADPA